jgi:hypothetical protein
VLSLPAIRSTLALSPNVRASLVIRAVAFLPTVESRLITTSLLAGSTAQAVPARDTLSPSWRVTALSALVLCSTRWGVRPS